MLPSPPPSGYTAALAGSLLAFDAPLPATSALAAALGVPTDAARGHRFSVGAPLPGTLLVEVLFGCVQLAKEHGFSAGQTARALGALHALLQGACAAQPWPSHAHACAQWARALQAITAPPLPNGARVVDASADAAAAAAAAAEAGGDAAGAADATAAAAEGLGGSPAGGAAGGAEDLLPPQLANALSAWVHDNGALLPHHWEMYREALTGAAQGGTLLLTRVGIVEEPPPPETLPPLAVARQLGGEPAADEAAAAAAAAAAAQHV